MSKILKFLNKFWTITPPVELYHQDNYDRETITPIKKVKVQIEMNKKIPYQTILRGFGDILAEEMN